MRWSVAPSYGLPIRAQGAQCFPAQLEAEALELAQLAAHAVGADYAGVDIIHSESDGWLVLEINGVPAWRGLQEVSEVDIAKSFAALIVVLVQNHINCLAKPSKIKILVFMTGQEYW